MTTNVYSDYGPSCDIYSPAIAREGETPVENISFDVTAFPNPFDNSFKLTLNTTSAEEVNVMVFDILGKQLEERTFKLEDIEQQEIGERLPSGMYLVKVIQGAYNMTKKMIKR